MIDEDGIETRFTYEIVLDELLVKLQIKLDKAIESVGAKVLEDILG